MDALVDHPIVLELQRTLRPRSRLKEHHQHLFFAHRDGDGGNNSDDNSDDSSRLVHAFRELGRVTCQAGVVNRKEFLETFAAAWEIHSHFSPVRRLADLAAGHGLLSWCLLVLDELGYEDEGKANDNNHQQERPRTVVCVDRRMPPAAAAIATAMLHRYPQLQERWTYIQSDLTAILPDPSCLLVSVHACGTLSDLLVRLAISYKAPLAMVPCCHTVNQEQWGYQPHPLSGLTADAVVALVETKKKQQRQHQRQQQTSQPKAVNTSTTSTQATLAEVVDGIRCQTLRTAGFAVHEVMLPAQFTPRNRLVLGNPPPPSSQEIPVAVGYDHEDQSTPESGETDQALHNGTTTTPPKQSLRSIPLADHPESMDQCLAISAATGLCQPVQQQQQQLTTVSTSIMTPPKHFSLLISLWLPPTSPSSSPPVVIKDVTLETLQELANQCCASSAIPNGKIDNDNDEDHYDLQCQIVPHGTVQQQDLMGRRFQLYHCHYKTSDGTHLAGPPKRRAAKAIHRAFRERIGEVWGADILR